MCGFAGFLQGNGLPVDQACALASRMCRQIAHRGPDDYGVWSDAGAGITLGHRRLSILDLSPAGHQPMFSAGGRYVIAFNGEIYNHQLLRQELENADQRVKWRGHSDTETLLACFEAWGVSGTIEKSVGMFAFALWDREQRVLTLGRDRLGEKPLYYGWQGEAFVFGSELRALRQHPAFSADINRGALALLMRHNYVPAPYSIFQGIFKLPPGSLLTVSLAHPEPRISTYWSSRGVIERGRRQPFEGDAAQAVSALESLLRDAIAGQMIADVPLGAFLSGGIDSSTVVALMQAQSSRPVRTFSIGFDDPVYDEAQHAKSVAKHLGTDHTEIYVTSQDALNVIPRLPDLYSEPFADSSQIPTFLVSQIARKHVVVSLSGDAGDELFCGYNRYLMGDQLWRRLQKMPSGLRQFIASTATRFSPQTWNTVLKPLQNVLPVRHRVANWGDKIHKGAAVVGSRSSVQLYRGLVSHWERPDSVVLHSIEPDTVLTDPAYQALEIADVERMMALDLVTYLPDDILCKVDRAAMAVSLETRVPFLDHRVVEFAWRLPLEFKLREGVSKWVLRQVLYKYVPRSLIERPKMGFGIPLGAWLRGPLRDWAEDLLSEARLRREGFFNVLEVRQKWKEHLSGQRNWQYHLWNVLMFQGWLACEE